MSQEEGGAVAIQERMDAAAGDGRTVDHVDVQRTGPGTLAGQYLRRFWHPVYRAEDLAPGQAVPIRIMSENYTLYRGEDGAPHVVAFRCAHRGAQLSVGWVEGDCIRCLYHGWKYAGDGQCVEQPGEDESFAGKVRIASYPTQDYLGLTFAYLGEGEPPPFPRYWDFERPGVLENGPPEVWPCNFFNRLDNDCDGNHVAFTHRESLSRTGQGDLKPRRISAEETEYGIKCRVETPERGTTYLYVLMPNVQAHRAWGSIEGSREDAQRLLTDRLTWRVPIDDTHCVSFRVDVMDLHGERARAYQERRRQVEQTQQLDLNAAAETILAGRMHLRDLEPDLSTYKMFRIEDYCAQVGIGPLADWRSEHLGRGDVGTILQRRIWQRELKALAAGQPLTNWRLPARMPFEDDEH